VEFCTTTGMEVRVVCNRLQLHGPAPDADCGPRGLCYLSHVDALHRSGVSWMEHS
jgi:hypothetical protein